MKNLSFSPHLLNRFNDLKVFLNSENEVKQIINEKALVSKELYFSRWRVTWILVKAPFEQVISLLMSGVAQILECVKATSISRFFRVLSEQSVREQHQLHVQKLFRERLLVPSFYGHQLRNYDLYCQPNLPAQFIRDPQVKEMTFLEQHRLEGYSTDCSQLHILDFYQGNGRCRGAVTWFIRLYLETEGMFAREKEHFIAVSRQFKTGIPSKAVLLQVLDAVEGPLLDMHTRSLAVGLDKIQSLSPGIYSVGTDSHCMVYLKVNEHSAYIWDPNLGAIELENPQSISSLRSIEKMAPSVTFTAFTLFSGLQRTA